MTTATRGERVPELPIEPPKGRREESVRILVLPPEKAKLLERLLEHEIKYSCCFEREYDAIGVKQELIALWERL